MLTRLRNISKPGRIKIPLRYTTATVKTSEGAAAEQA